MTCKWEIFATNSLVWEAAPIADGLIILAFNSRLRISRSFLRTTHSQLHVSGIASRRK
ncbi:hypothetical protein OESDEN_11851 [Oesophagostomum dentatum]|uniref:Uncharacterized protein n=1 Tax=Oesophagostomum dentatum TaxID=61180 RepID=A0A0B1SWR4_OESDE|nr:hypothetical protein OESDEN_11851 [Oesophagostomum dentatum]